MLLSVIYNFVPVIYSLLFFYSSTTPSLPDRLDIDTEEDAASNVFSEADVMQGCLSCSVTTENRDSKLSTGPEDAGVLNSETCVKISEENPQGEENVPFLSEAKVFLIILFFCKSYNIEPSEYRLKT